MRNNNKKELEHANSQFYDALNSFDLDLMQNVWLNDKNVKCIHPGWPVIEGWEAVRESWKNIFESSGFNHVNISKLFIDVKNDSGWLNCVERTRYKFKNEIIVTLAQTTNIFELRNDKWQMVLHHSSPMPAPMGEKAVENIQ